MNDELRYKIATYLDGTMSSEDCLLFEKAISQDSELKQEIIIAQEMQHFLSGNILNESIPSNERTKEMREFLQSQDARDTRTTLEEAKTKYAGNQVGNNRKQWLWRVAAIAVILLMATGALLFFQPDSNQELYAQYYSERDLPSLIQRGDSEDLLGKGVLAFQEKQYETALQYFNEYQVDAEEILPAVYLYNGIAHLETKSYEAGLNSFDKMLQSNSIDSSKGLWFKALAYLKMDDEELTIKTLGLIVESEANFNYAKAKKLLEDLK